MKRKKFITVAAVAAVCVAMAFACTKDNEESGTGSGAADSTGVEQGDSTATAAFRRIASIVSTSDYGEGVDESVMTLEWDGDHLVGWRSVSGDYSHSETISWDGDRVSSSTYNGEVGGGGIVRTVFNYDGDRLSGWEEWYSDGSLYRTTRLTYNSDGKVVRQEETGADNRTYTLVWQGGNVVAQYCHDAETGLTDTATISYGSHHSIYRGLLPAVGGNVAPFVLWSENMWTSAVFQGYVWDGYVSDGEVHESYTLTTGTSDVTVEEADGAYIKRMTMRDTEVYKESGRTAWESTMRATVSYLD